MHVIRGVQTSGSPLPVGRSALRKLPVARSKKPRSRGRLSSGDIRVQHATFCFNGKPSNHHRTTARAGHSASPIPYHRRSICKYRGRLFIPWQARPLPRAGAIRLSHSLKQHDTRHTSDHGWPSTPSAARLATPTSPRRTTRSLVRRRAATSPWLQSSSCRPGIGQEAGEEACLESWWAQARDLAVLESVWVEEKMRG